MAVVVGGGVGGEPRVLEERVHLPAGGHLAQPVGPRREPSAARVATAARVALLEAALLISRRPAAARLSLGRRVGDPPADGRRRRRADARRRRGRGETVGDMAALDEDARLHVLHVLEEDEVVEEPLFPPFLFFLAAFASAIGDQLLDGRR